MGKVASSTIKLTLSDIDGVKAMHTHSLNPASTRKLNTIKKHLGWKVTSTSDRATARKYKSLKNENQKKIVTLVREPISRNISAFFQVLDQITGIEDAHTKYSTAGLLELFFKHYPHDIPLTWFDREFKPTLGIDIYSYPFPKEDGSMIINEGEYDILVMRHDLDDKSKEACLKRFLGVNEAPIKITNTSIQKNYADTYRRFIQDICLPVDYISRMLDSKYSNHFYTAQELTSIRQAWKNKNQLKSNRCAGSSA